MKLIFTVINDLTTDQRMMRICSALSVEGHEVELIGRTKRDSSPLLKRGYKQTRLTCWFEKGKLFYLEYNIRLFIYLLGKRNYGLTAIDLDTSISALWLNILLKREFYFDAHEMFTEVPEVIDRKGVQKIWLWIEKRVFKRAQKIYTVGYALKKYFEDLHQVRNILVIRNTPYLLEQVNHIEQTISLPNDPFILYQGALNKGRGLERLIRIIHQFNLKYPLVIAGEGDIRRDLEFKVQEYGLEQQVLFLGQISPVVLPFISRKAKIGYNVSENLGLSYYYSLNNKFFDYVEAELPSVINDFPEYREHINSFEVGILVSVDDEAIVKAIQNLMEESATWNRIKSQCSLARKEWNWEREKQILTELYRDFKE